MKTNKVFAFLILALVFFSVHISSCTWDKPEVPIRNTTVSVENPIDTMNNPGFNCPDYPENIRSILVNKCATAGCHNAVSYAGASGLDLTSWLTMRRGSSAGAVVIPGNPDYSTLFSFSNTYADLGFDGNEPKMPYNGTALSRDEITTLKNWINEGAHNACGDPMFSDDCSNSKLFISNQGCDQVVTLDPATRLIQKWFNVGVTPVTESPHMMKVSPDGQYLYVALYSGLIQRYRTCDESFVDEIDVTAGTGISGGQWGTIAIGPDGKKGYSVDYSNNRIATINLENFPMTAYTSYSLASIDFYFPHGITTNQAGDKLYITDQVGGNVFIVDTASSISRYVNVVIPNFTKVPTGSSKIHEVFFSLDYSKYFITCESTSEVRVFNTSDNSLITSIPVGTLPQEFSISSTHPYLFVSCTEDIMPEGRGSIAVIDYNTLTLVKKIYTGTQPHGLAVDDAKNIVYVANRNYDANGDAPHHTGACAGRNGYLTLIDMNTLELVPGYKCELGVNPYSVVLKK